MALIPCKACGNPTSTTARQCMRCGGPPPKSYALLWVLLGVFLALLTVVSIVGVANRSPDRKQPAAPAAVAAPREMPVVAPAAPAPEPPPAVSVTAGQLYKDYRTNEVGADEHYRGRMLLVSGIVGEIRKDYANKPYVRFLAAGGEARVYARFPGPSVGLGDVAPGSVITVRCLGSAAMGVPELKDCTLEHMPQ